MKQTPGVTTCILIFLLMVLLSLWLFKQLNSTKFNDAIINYFRIGFALRGTGQPLQKTCRTFRRIIYAFVVIS